MNPKKISINRIISYFVFILITQFIGCGENHRDSSPILLLGMDGLEWDYLIPVMQKGKLPNFARMIQKGYYGKLETLSPTISPAIWTSVATGKIYKKHGIKSFYRKDPEGNKRLIYSFERRTKSLWNIFSDYK